MSFTRPAAPSARATVREWTGLAVIALPCMLYSMDLTVLNLAIPSISEDLRPTASQLLWIVDIYGFFVAGLLVTMGTLGDRIGRRRLLLIGAFAFGVASVLAAFSTSANMLIATRALLGVAGATLAPSTLSLIRNVPRPGAAHAGHRRVDLELLGGRGHRPGAGRGAVAVLCVGLGVAGALTRTHTAASTMR
jgi:DHA2 family multidrug resistance protein-like MFS transporter